MSCNSCKDNNPLPPSYGDEPVYPAVDGYPSWSPDGSNIIYNHAGITKIYQGGASASNPDSAGLWIMDADGSNQRLLMKGDYYDADWSPDGQWIVMNFGLQIYKMKLNSDSLIQLTFSGNNFFPDWSPDGRWIAYSASYPEGYAGLWIIPETGFGNSARKLGGGAWPNWHPNGRLIIGVIGTSPTSIWTRFVQYHPFDTLKSDTLAGIIGNDNRSPRYSPNGTQIAFWSKGTLWVMDTLGYHLKQLTTQGAAESLDWSPDGMKIVYVNYSFKNYDPKNNGTVWLMNADGANKHQLTYGPNP